MITINNCKISSSGKCLNIKATIPKITYYDNMYIQSVSISTDEDYIKNIHKTKEVYSNNDKDVKSINLTVTAKELGLDSFNDNMFFVYITCGGIPAITTPCGMDEATSCCVAVNMKPIYDSAMNYIKELNDTCNIPRNFIDFILRFKAYELAVRSGHFNKAIQYWYKIRTVNVPNIVTNKCGCNGIT